MAATPFLADLVELNGACRRCACSRARGADPAGGGGARARLGLAVAASWGMTENAGMTITPHDGSAGEVPTDGRALPARRGRRRTTRSARAADTVGALQVRGASLFVGYLKRPQLYPLDQDGWFDTGDLARMDADGYIRICGRTKDVIIRGGENIPVVEIENRALPHPAVADAAVVAMPDARLGERACASSSLKPGRGSISSSRRCQPWRPKGFSKHFLARAAGAARRDAAHADRQDPEVRAARARQGARAAGRYASGTRSPRAPSPKGARRPSAATSSTPS